MQTADRLGEVKEYYFSKKLREIAELRKAGKSIINLGIGSPDLAPPQAAIEALQKGALSEAANHYQSYQGLPALREAIALFSENNFGIELNPDSEILPLMGSKEGITHLSLAFLNKGDQVLVPDLGYPTYTSVTKMVEAEVVHYPLIEDNNWEPDWVFLEGLDYSNIKMLYLNYPHMPTGAAGRYEVFERFVTLAKRHDLILIHDNPYSFILNDQPMSIFSVPEAKEVAFELNSLSKTFNMAGWRVGWLSGAAENIANVLRIKSNMDSGMYRPVQEAAIAALAEDKNWFDQLARVYVERRKKAFELLDRLNCTYAMDQRGMFVWAKSPSEDVDELVDQLLYDKGIFITPGHIFGEKGRRYLRISLCSPVETFDEVISRL